jgi:hypothetical protein
MIPALLEQMRADGMPTEADIHVDAAYERDAFERQLAAASTG